MAVMVHSPEKLDLPTELLAMYAQVVCTATVRVDIIKVQGKYMHSKVSPRLSFHECEGAHAVPSVPEYLVPAESSCALTHPAAIHRNHCQLPGNCRLPEYLADSSIAMCIVQRAMPWCSKPSL
jgi:hypothetical protein